MIGIVLKGRYLVEEPIGAGGMAEVFRGIDLNTDRTVAIKVLREEFAGDEEFVKRFQREAHAAAALSNQFLVGVHDLGNEDGVQFIVMDYVKGINLKDIIRDKGALPVDLTVRFARQICDALEHAHNEHIIHRDIKPQNIIIDTEGRAKLTDFGIARATTSQTVTLIDGAVMGTVHYFSPEQARGLLAEEQSDLYSLGVVIYEMATGEVPFNGDSPVTIALAHLQEPPVDPRRLNPNIPAALCEVIFKAMEKDKADRYQTAAEMAADLRMVMQHPEGGFIKKRQLSPDDPTRLVPIVRPNDTTVQTPLTQPPVPGVETGADLAGTDPDTPVRTTRAWSVVAILIIVMAFAGIIWLVISMIDRFTGGGYVYVPDVMNTNITLACEAITEMGLYPLVEYDYNDIYERDFVCDQVPQSKTQVETGSTVTLVISLGPYQIETPNVLMMQKQEAVGEIERRGLVPQIETQDSERPRGTVVGQQPENGTPLRNGDIVTIFVSEPPVIRQTPEVRERTLDEASSIISAAGLLVGDVFEQAASDIEPGIVIRQSPEAGESALDGSSVDLWVSAEPEPGYRKTVSVMLNLPESGGDVRIEQVDDNGEKITLVNKYYEGGLVPIELNLVSESTGKYTLMYYVDNIVTKQDTVTFTEEDKVGE